LSRARRGVSDKKEEKLVKRHGKVWKSLVKFLLFL
jgi:hypothetical protein